MSIISLIVRSSHEASHKHADERGSKVRYPWEKTARNDADTAALSRFVLAVIQVYSLQSVLYVMSYRAAHPACKRLTPAVLRVFFGRLSGKSTHLDLKTSPIIQNEQK